MLIEYGANTVDGIAQWMASTSFGSVIESIQSMPRAELVQFLLNCGEQAKIDSFFTRSLSQNDLRTAHSLLQLKSDDSSK